MSTAWLYLICAGIFEIAWPVGLKISQTPGRMALGISLAAVGLLISGWLLWMAQRQIPIGTAYAVWTGIGAAGTFLVGIFVYGDPAGMLRILGVVLIISGVIVLKLAH